MFMIHKINGNLREVLMPRENFLLEAKIAHASIMVHISKKTKIHKYLACRRVTKSLCSKESPKYKIESEALNKH